MPSSPSRPCRARKQTSGASSRSRRTRSWSTSMPCDSWPRRLSASSTRAPERSETSRSSERPPLRTATRLMAGGPSARASGWSCGRAAAAARRPAPDRASGAVASARRAGAGREPGQRAEQLQLLGDDLADAPDALADVRVADAGEVQPHRRAAAAVEVGAAPRHERDVALQRAGEQVGGVDLRRAASPRRTGRPRAASRSPRPGSARPAPRAACRGGRGRGASATPGRAPTGPRGSTALTKCWVSDEVQRSAPCLPMFIFCSTGAGATAQPSRRPADRILENVPK